MTRRTSSWTRWLWTELTRPRGAVRSKYYRGGRRSKAGVALLMTITSVMLLSILVTEIGYSAVQRAQVAAQYRDEVAAEYLARSGAQFHFLILIASQTIGQSPMIQGLAEMTGGMISGNELWQIIPFIDTRFLRMVIVDAPDAGDLEDVAKAGGLTDEQIEQSREEGSSLTRRSFLDFDGDFHTTAVDVERLINVRKIEAQSIGECLSNNPACLQLNALFSSDDYQTWLNANNLVKEELIGNLVDWTDIDDVRLYQGGSEDAVYDRGDENQRYRSKNAPFDTREEIRLVEGWHLDGVWERVGRQLTVYGSGGINVNTATRLGIFGLIKGYLQSPVNDLTIFEAVDEYISLRGAPASLNGINITAPEQFVGYFQNQFGFQFREDIAQAITTQSKVFRITSVGEVGAARAEVEMVVDFSQGGAGRLIYWNVR